jgi:ribosomal protein S18 acetylase RimI-like enzyme
MHEPKVQIRTARESDFLDCVTIARQAWPEFHERESIYHLFCKFFSNTSFICRRGDRTIAFVLGFLSQIDASQAYIHLVAVDPSCQREGVAHQLYSTFLQTVRARGVRQVRLIVNPDNFGSLAFHKRLGFTEDLHEPLISIDGVLAVRDYNGPGIHMVPFVKDLAIANGDLS